MARHAGLAAISFLLGLERATPLASAATHYQTLQSLGQTGASGQKPYAGVVTGNDGALYGTAVQGGTNGAGTVFKLNLDGSGYGVLHTFLTNGVDGRSPGALIRGSDGMLYGTTSIGGTGNAGTAYRLNRDGSGYSLLHTFKSVVADGLNPQGGLAEGSDGALYGTTFFGGSNDMGTVFKMNKDGSNYRVLVHFSLSAEGLNPATAVVEGRDGALYGTTNSGGTNDAGTVFKVNKDGSGYSILHRFTSVSGDGETPDGALVQGSDEALYGTTVYGGTNGVGTVFRLTTNGTAYSVLHRFANTGGDGQNPRAALVEGWDGALYGTTFSGGGSDAGALFTLNKDGNGYSIWRSFSNAGGDGQNPRGGLVIGSDGAFYGTTWLGGQLGVGTVFRIWPPQAPEMIGVALVGGTAQVRFAGTSGYRYQVLRSTNLANWVGLETITMPLSGIYTNTDSTPPSPTASYRAAWQP